ncbi:hypothetical protein [Microbacterium sp. SORGH_AS_0888]|uniref:hypothetical protein n=1 Tax=Microbacterium sp. SORGH_AS_0888 TaxID=3041791 RepID=UPI002788362B|nr:hypothetical protein [Microbacterium sp. SORGH_AS_0888]MDQ1130255.1 hypothetical protein [Microbacterium sp. SORGH_AS_0888]
MSMFSADDPLARQIEAAYLEAWAALSTSLKAKLRSGAETLDSEEVRELARLPHPLLTLSYWLEEHANARWNVSFTFAEWARREAPDDV